MCVSVSVSASLSLSSCGLSPLWMQRVGIDKRCVLWNLRVGMRGECGELYVSDYSAVPLTGRDPSTAENWIQQT